jgi:hypothetical protein
MQDEMDVLGIGKSTKRSPAYGARQSHGMKRMKDNGRKTNLGENKPATAGWEHQIIE